MKKCQVPYEYTARKFAMQKQDYLKKNPVCAICIQKGLWIEAHHVIHCVENGQCPNNITDIFTFKSVCTVHWHNHLAEMNKGEEESV